MTNDVKKAIKAPPVRWGDVAARLAAAGPGNEALDSVSRDLSSEAVGAMRRAAYFNARSLGKDHGKAVLAAKAATRAAAKALGFTYPMAHDLYF